MNSNYLKLIYIKLFFLGLIISGCEAPTRFQLLNPEQTGVDFVNHLEETPQMNVFTYLYFYNGGGVAAGDLNGDDLIDLFFTSNQDSNRVYLNKGNFQFKDITIPTGLFGKKGWTTGVSMADVNGDGRLDIYVSQLGDYKNIIGKNQLYINLGNNKEGIPRFEDQAHQWGLDLKGFSTQAAFFDYDLDGDLDLYMLNHSVHSNGTYEKAEIRTEKHPLAGDKLMRNQGDHFEEVTEAAGIYSSALGYGLGISISDINWDGYPDIYIGNDFHEDDYLYINQGDGTFQEQLGLAMAHTGRYSMGNDIADINNDGLPDIVSLDMLPSDPEKLKASAGEDAYDVYYFKLNYGYKHQFSRNTFQLNLGNGKFSDIALMADMAATDWSWSSLLADFDLDGKRDLFISNGIKRRMNDLDYINFISNDAVQHRLEGDLTDDDLNLVNHMPVVKISNFIYQNKGNLSFEDVSNHWGFDQASFSNGAVYADLDNDGDLDLVTNNVDQPAFIYRNRSREQETDQPNYLKIRFKGKGKNRLGVGAKIMFSQAGETFLQEMFPVRGFQSSMPYEMVIGLGTLAKIDSLWVIWPDQSYQVLNNVQANQLLLLDQEQAKGKFFRKDPASDQVFREVNLNGLDYLHRENKFVEFNREPLIPHMSSTEGPHLITGDLNGDGMDDIWMPGPKRVASQVFLQNDTGFYQLDQPAFRSDSLPEDIMAELVDFDQDQDLDLVVVSGGNEFQGEAAALQVRTYQNDGNGNFQRVEGIIPDIYLTASAIVKADYDLDGDFDLFISGSVVPWHYGLSPSSFLLRNQGDGTFTDVTNQVEGLAQAGMIKAVQWADLNNDQYPELILAGEWMPLRIFYNYEGKLKYETVPGIDDLKGWWQSLVTADIDQDGDLDILAGNLGLNSKLKASTVDPVSLYYGDFDGNQVNEQLLVYSNQGEKHLFPTKDELVKQLPKLKSKYLKYKDFAQASLYDIFPKDQLEKALHLEVTEFRSGCFINQGEEFVFQPFPREAQTSNLRALQIIDYNQDGFPDALGGGNFFDVNVQFGRYDAGLGVLLQNDGRGNLTWIPHTKSGLNLEGQVRDIQPLVVQDKTFYLIGKNNSELQVIGTLAATELLYADKR